MSVFDYWGEDDGPDQIDNEIPGDIVRHKQWGHAKIWQRDKPLKHWWARRASSLGDPLADMFAIHRWQLRLAVQGVLQNIDLVQLFQSIPLLTQEPRGDETREEYETRMRPFKRAADAIVEQALDRIGATRKANRGTALHRLDESIMRGDRIGPVLDPQLRMGVEKLHELRRGLIIHEMERFVVFEDPNPPIADQRIASCGTLDWTWSLAPGWMMALPDGQLIVPGQRRVGDTKSGDNNIHKTPYLAQPTTYVLGEPYDWMVSEEDRRGGDSGIRPWLDYVPPEQDWALIAHVPLDPEHFPGSALWWVDMKKAELYARMAAQVRASWTLARRETKLHFYTAKAAEVADEELAERWLDANRDQRPAIVPVEEPRPATVTEIITVKIERAKTPDEVVAVHQAHRLIGWTAEHAALAERRWAELTAAQQAAAGPLEITGPTTIIDAELAPEPPETPTPEES